MIETGIYLITNTSNGKVYIGKSKNLTKRLNKHRSELLRGLHSNKHLQAAYNLYGSNSFKYEVLIRCEEALLYQYEIDLIYLANLQDRSIGYNQTAGGDGGLGIKISEETRQRLRDSHLGIKDSEETKRKKSISGKLRWIKRKKVI